MYYPPPPYIVLNNIKLYATSRRLIFLAAAVLMLIIFHNSEKPANAVGCCTIDSRPNKGWCYQHDIDPPEVCRACCEGNGACIFTQSLYYADYFYTTPSSCPTVSDPCYAVRIAYFQNRYGYSITRKAHRAARQTYTCSFNYDNCIPYDDDVICPHASEWQTTFNGYAYCSSGQCDIELCPDD
jgi:hypothetical protein